MFCTDFMQCDRDCFFFSKYAVVSFVGYSSSDIVPTSWIVVQGTEEDDCVTAWFPNCHISQPRKCMQLVRGGKPYDESSFKKYTVKMLYLTGRCCKNAVLEC